jgi:hypothetical protein
MQILAVANQKGGTLYSNLTPTRTQFTCTLSATFPLRGGDDALIVDWCEITVTHGETGEVLYHNAFVTNHRLTEQSVVPIARAGRTR